MFCLIWSPFKTGLSNMQIDGNTITLVLHRPHVDLCGNSRMNVLYRIIRMKLN